jgi:heme oxygenase (biliverdin-producing, ferredoxin)
MDPLSQLLREGTKAAHTMAENVGFVKCFLKGSVERSSYRQLLANFYFIYDALETALETHKDHPILAGLYYPQLYRRTSLEQDLRYYYGPNWQTQATPTPAAKRYVEIIERLSQENPTLLIAHGYTRYIGDLSGGQILKEIAERSMGLVDGLGTAFYHFDQIPDAKQFKQEYRAALDKLPVDAQVAQSIVDEAIASFQLNMHLFEELEGSLIRAIGQMVFNSLTRRRPRQSVVTASE